MADMIELTDKRKAPYILEINGDKFTFTDEDGVDHTVRLMDTKNPLQQTKNGSFYEGTITLREEIA